MLRLFAALLLLTASAVPALANQSPLPISSQTAAEETVGETPDLGLWG